MTSIAIMDDAGSWSEGTSNAVVYTFVVPTAYTHEGKNQYDGVITNSVL